MLDFDLALLYEIQTKALKQAVRRNIERFPNDFMFVLKECEWKELVTNCDQLPKEMKHTSALPFAFTQEGVAMLSGILRSSVAVQVNINIMRAFVRMREYLLLHPESVSLAELKNQIKELQEDIRSLEKDHEDYEQHFDDIYLALAQLASRNKEQEKKERPRIGFVKTVK